MNGLKAFDLTGKVALVTGCKRGIGRGMAEALASAGADIIGVSATLENSGSDVEKSVTAMGRHFTGYACDFSDRQSVLEFAKTLSEQGIVPDILINNAGTIKRQPAAEHPTEWWDEVIEVNLSAQFLLSREIGKHMIERGSGKIIFTASLLTFQGGITVPGYAASKGGIGQLTKALANEWGSKGVNVNAIAPGYMDTQLNTALINNKKRTEEVFNRVPMKRWGTGEDLKGIAVFLSSSASDYITGCVIPVDGGYLAR